MVEAVWRHLLVGAREGQRRWASLSALANELGAPISTTHRSLAHPIEIGAVSVSSLEGLQVLDPVRLLVLFAAHRHVRREIRKSSQVDASAVEVERLATNPAVVLGGFGAVVAHLGGTNRIADYSTVLFYGDPGLPDLLPAQAGHGTEVLIAEPDPLLKRYGRVTPLAQAYADLFSLPGWQAARFVDELDPRRVATHEEPFLLV
ncbi:MAG TPA: hypothetical protein VMS00_07985 [Acidimicrobiales bacterium]|nr:hypothetical protein [Acidimicrobiales bacterium]